MCCVLDEDEKYAVMLADFINSKHIFCYNAIAFTSKLALEESLERYDIKLLINGVDKTEFEQADNVVWLVDEKNPSMDNAVCKFQAAESLVKDILLKSNNLTYAGKRTNSKIITVYSPATKCFKTSCAIANAIELGRESKVLLLNFEQFSGLENILCNVRGGLSEALYYYKLSEANAIGKVMACMDRFEGFDYLAPAVCADDISDLTNGELIKFILFLVDKGDYDNVIVDAGGFYGCPWELLELSDIVVMPNALDCMGKRKVAGFEKYLLSMDKMTLLDKIVKMDIAYIETLAGYEITREKIMEYCGVYRWKN